MIPVSDEKLELEIDGFYGTNSMRKVPAQAQCHLVKRKVLCIAENVMQGAFFSGIFKKDLTNQEKSDKPP